MRKILVLAGLILAGPFTFAAATPDIVGMPYEQAREHLSVSLYTALTQDQIKLVPNYSEVVDSTQSEFIKKGFLEVFNCTGSGIPICEFLFANSDGKIYSVRVYVPEGGGETRVEELFDTGLTMLASGEIAPELNVLQERIALLHTSPKPMMLAGAKYVGLEPCDQECVNKEVLETPAKVEDLGVYVDPVSGYEVPDFRNKNIVRLQGQLGNYTLIAVPNSLADDKTYGNTLAFVINKVTNGALAKCAYVDGGRTQCDMLYQNFNGYLYRITAKGEDLNSFIVSSVSVVNGLQEYASYTTKELASEVRAQMISGLYNTDKGAYRTAMREHLKDSTDPFSMYAKTLDDTNYSKGFCDQFVAMSYMYAAGNYPETTKASMLEEMASASVRAGCVKLEYR